LLVQPEDLKEERKEVIQALLELDCIPVGMELFPAADDDQWTLIRELIDDCDYYILISLGLVPRCLQRVKKRFLKDTPSACSGEFHQNLAEIYPVFSITTKNALHAQFCNLCAHESFRV
jgi:hypothetical protein